jgi:23S rRNA (pseudouridine1915-N3)-methyltransferase
MIDLICVGKLSTKGYKEAFDHYSKQINKLHVTELKESSIQVEGKHILNLLDRDAHIILLTIEGVQMDSIAFAEYLRKLIDTGKKIQFVVGGSEGLSESVKSASNKDISMSKMTFPHQLARVMLVEQIYRAMKIIERHPYHK